MDQKYKITLGVALLVVAFAVGRYSVKETVRVETKIVEVEKKVKARDKRKETKVVEVTKPDGTKEKTKTIVEDTKTNVNIDKTTNVDQISERRGDSSRGSVSILGGVDLNGSFGRSVVFGGIVTGRVIGPISVGVWGLSNASFGGSLGVEF
jgi:hypothetical protein